MPNAIPYKNPLLDVIVVTDSSGNDFRIEILEVKANTNAFDYTINHTLTLNSIQKHHSIQPPYIATDCFDYAIQDINRFNQNSASGSNNHITAIHNPNGYNLTTKIDQAAILSVLKIYNVTITP